MTRTPRRWASLALTLGVLLVSMVLAHQPQATSAQSAPNANPNVVISFPPAVYVVRGQVEVRGTVNLPNLSNYFLEVRALDASTLRPASEDEPFAPASLAQTGVKIDDVLLVWDTTVLEDGLYEIRLRANVSRQGATDFVVSPLRVENTPPPFLVEAIQATPTHTITPAGGSVIVIGGTPTAGGVIISRPTLQATPSPTGDPTVTANTDANVRVGDSTSYPTVGTPLLAGEQARLLGISASGSGWYYIELSNGRRGFIAPSIVTVAGNVAGLQRIQPPPPPATPTPTRPPSTGDAVANGIGLVPAEPRCNEAFQVQVNVSNVGSATFSGGGTLFIYDEHIASGTRTTTGTGSFPALAPGQNFVVVIPMIVNSFPAEDHRIVAVVDSNNNIAEENEGNNTFLGTAYRLRRAGCP